MLGRLEEETKTYSFARKEKYEIIFSEGNPNVNISGDEMYFTIEDQLESLIRYAK